MTLLALVIAVVVGLAVLPSDLRFGWGPRLAGAFCAGAFAISLEMFLFDLAGIGWNVAVLLLPWACLISLRAYRSGGMWLPRPKTNLEPSHAILLGALVPLVFLLPYERLMPLTMQTWDSWAIWLLKSKAFFEDGTISTFLARSAEFKGQPGYPLLVPLYGTFVYLLNGEVADQAAKFYSPCFFLALLGVFYGFARRLANVTVAASLTVIVALLPAVASVAFELPGYADTALAAYLVAGGGFLYFWLRDGETSDLWGVSLAATSAAWTKNEGQVFLAIALLAGAWGLVRHKGAAWRWMALLAPGLGLMIVWSLVRTAYEVEAAGFAPGLAFQTDLFTLSLSTLLSKAFSPSLFALAFYLLAASLILWKPLKGPPEFWCLPVLVLAQVGAALLAYATGRNEINWWLGTSADRILSQVAPLALLPVAVLLGHAWQEEPPTSSDPAAPKKIKRKRGR